jgi:hypothetical protein
MPAFPVLTADFRTVNLANLKISYRYKAAKVHRTFVGIRIPLVAHQLNKEKKFLYEETFLPDLT